MLCCGGVWYVQLVGFVVELDVVVAVDDGCDGFGVVAVSGSGSSSCGVSCRL